MISEIFRTYISEIECLNSGADMYMCGTHYKHKSTRPGKIHSCQKEETIVAI